MINLPVDDEGRNDLSLEELKRMIVEEINKHNSDNFDFQNDYEEECEDYWQSFNSYDLQYESHTNI